MRAAFALLAAAAACAQAFEIMEAVKCQLCEVRRRSGGARRSPRGRVHAAELTPAAFPPRPPQTAAPSGAIEDCCCDAETVDKANTRHFLPILHELTKR